MKAELQKIIPRFDYFGLFQMDLAPELKIILNLKETNLTLCMDFTLYENMGYQADYENYSLYENRQRKILCELTKNFQEIIDNEDTKIIFGSQWLPIWLIKIRQKTNHPIILRYLKDDAACITCDGDGYAQYGPAKLYRCTYPTPPLTVRIYINNSTGSYNNKFQKKDYVNLNQIMGVIEKEGLEIIERTLTLTRRGRL